MVNHQKTSSVLAHILVSCHLMKFKVFVAGVGLIINFNRME